MVFLKVLAGLVLALVILFFAGAMLLPDEVQVSRSIGIDAPPEAILPFLVDFHRFNEWSPWFERDPETIYTFEGPDQGVGAAMRWQSDDPNVGSGRQEITAVDDRRVETSLVFEGAGEADAVFLLEPQGDSTEVTWAFDTTLNGPVERWFGLFFDSMIGADYETGLAKLAAVVAEDIQNQPTPAAVEPPPGEGADDLPADDLPEEDGLDAAA